ncbi:glycosyl hydrolase family 28-related protein [Knoellia sp. LjRoot47]|uniref:glycosyl hydrolase family 28-related protein n=1 Tax=Knoellia sp. LjRoot47 TaxID=3342330 RepID=UPI003ECC3C5E
MTPRPPWFVDVRAHGAVGDGRTDDTMAIRRAVSAVLAGRRDDVVSHALFFPPGTYRVTRPDTLMWSPTRGRSDPVFGLSILGCGPRVSEILYDRTAARVEDPRAGNLLTAAVRLRYLKVAELSFRSENPGNRFAYFWSRDGEDDRLRYPAYGTGQNQNISFERVEWRGTWDRVIGIDGDQQANNNSEWMFDGCSTSVDFTVTDAMLRVGITSPANNAQQNQFLNFMLLNCHMALRKGTMLRFDRGGSINILGGSWSMASKDIGPCTAIHLPRRNGDPSVARLLVQGVRFEPKAANHRIIDCAWENGSVTFDSCSDVASLQNPSAAGYALHVYRTTGGNRLPLVRYRDCALAGSHVVAAGARPAAGGRMIYEGTRLLHHRVAYGPKGFLRSTPTPTRYAFRDCIDIHDTAAG